ncbi:MAG: hypothetical protein ACI3ZD_00610 [Prevotella sp.]
MYDNKEVENMTLEELENRIRKEYILLLELGNVENAKRIGRTNRLLMRAVSKAIKLGKKTSKSLQWMEKGSCFEASASEYKPDDWDERTLTGDEGQSWDEWVNVEVRLVTKEQD